MKHRMMTAIVTLSLVVPSGVALAQDIILEDVVTAEIEKPQAFYVLRASELEYEGMKPEESFLEELYKTVEKPPF